MKIKNQLNMLKELQESSDFYGWRSQILEKVMDTNNGKFNYDKWFNDAKSLIPEYTLLTDLLRGSISCKSIISVILDNHPIIKDEKYPSKVYPKHLKRKFPKSIFPKDSLGNFERYDEYLEKLRFIAGNAGRKFLEQLIEEVLKKINDHIQNMIQWLLKQPEKDQIPEEFLITDFVIHHQLVLAFSRYLGNDYLHDGCYRLWLNNSIKLKSLNDEENKVLRGNACLFEGDEEFLCVIEFFWSTITKNQWDNLPKENKSLKGNFKYYHGKFKDDRFNTIPLMII
jgi:hypothetical protein